MNTIWWNFNIILCGSWEYSRFVVFVALHWFSLAAVFVLWKSKICCCFATLSPSQFGYNFTFAWNFHVNKLLQNSVNHIRCFGHANESFVGVSVGIEDELNENRCLRGILKDQLASMGVVSADNVDAEPTLTQRKFIGSGQLRLLYTPDSSQPIDFRSSFVGARVYIFRTSQKHFFFFNYFYIIILTTNW